MGIQFPTWGSTPSPCGRLVWSPQGIGSTRTCAPSAAAMSFWAAMRPSSFLELATPLAVPRSSLQWLGRQVRAGHHLAPPVLLCWLARQGAEPLVVRHDGRHRTTLAQTLCGDTPIPVLLSFSGPAADCLDVATLSCIARRGMRAQRSGRHVAGPLFKEEVEEEAGRHPTGIPPPMWTGHVTEGTLRPTDREEDTTVIAAMLHNRKLDRFHPIFFYASSKPSEGDDDVCRFRSYGHHTEGFATRAEADADVASDCADGRHWNSGVDFEWSGEGSPASTHYFSRSQDPSCKQSDSQPGLP